MHSRKTKISDLVKEHLQTKKERKKRNQNGRGRVKAGSRKRKGKEEGAADLFYEGYE